MAVTDSNVQSSPLDKIKLVIAFALVAVAIGGFYYFAQESVLYRVLGMLAVMLVAIGVAYTSAPGRRLVDFIGNARTEVRKMVWPTRVETMQTTAIVVVIVAILSIFLLIIDSILSWAVKLFLSTGA
ncbi:MAG: Preprotein translocase subunit SecE (TC 3.A.5.1.1) [uncultured Thiotrichaceae bacterium]|uniref:Protein translocase subunit SecE n=1 Tax=uncultured Thiotrichaceae bacterium TaxID=298394 RepID=A0A6S6SFL3_9GAMM|nr:MAG: Preprotein translocase subunit SecE (TC 3.A.5.1.1) [uncultured Thiotrichaceae bacterium]